MIPLLIGLAVATAPVGLDSRHIPFGSPLGDMPIVIAPGESPKLLQKPLSEAEFWRQRRIAIARANRDPRMQALARRIAENERAEAARQRPSESAPKDPR